MPGSTPHGDRPEWPDGATTGPVSAPHLPSSFAEPPKPVPDKHSASEKTAGAARPAGAPEHTPLMKQHYGEQKYASYVIDLT